MIINEKLLNFDELQLAKHWKIDKLFDRIYKINVDGKELKWIIKSYKDKNLAYKEYKLLTKLKNIDGVPKLLLSGTYKNYHYYNIISRFKGSDLFDIISDYGAIKDENIVKDMVKNMLMILKNIHEKKIIHQDIKPENIIYDVETQKINIIDFEGKYTVTYASPEYLQKKKITEKTDLWSLGATIYFILKGKCLFENRKEVATKDIRMSKKWTKELQDFLSCLLDRNPKTRYSAQEALSHPWISCIL
jgi:serine/threonine protein kinase